jgi:hypothetical protein
MGEQQPLLGEHLFLHLVLRQHLFLHWVLRQQTRHSEG